MEINKFYYNDKDNYIYYLNNTDGNLTAIIEGKVYDYSDDMSYSQFISHNWTECTRAGCKIISCEDQLRNIKMQTILVEEKLNKFDKYLNDMIVNTKGDAQLVLLYDILDGFKKIFTGEY